MSKANDLLLKYTTTIASNLERVNSIEIAKSTGKMVKANIDQLDQGKKNDNNPITPFYSDAYAKKKGFQIPDLKDTGDFHNGIFVDYTQRGLNFDSRDYKTDILTEKYTVDIFGLTQENATKIFNEIYAKDYTYISRIANKYL